MGRPKGGKNREWSKEQKFEVVKYCLSGYTQRDTCAHFKIGNEQLITWINSYNEQGIDRKNKTFV